MPHTMVSRVAEWALGDEIEVVAHAGDVRFALGPSPLVTTLDSPGWAGRRKQMVAR